MTAIQTRPGTRPLLGPATVAGAAASVLMLAGLYLDTPWKKQGNKEWALTTNHQSIAGLLLSLGFVAAGLAVVFGVVVSRGLRGPARTATRRSLALAVTGAVSAVVFWTGLPVILAVGAVVLAVDSRMRLGRTPTTTWIVVVLAVLTTAAAVSLALVG
jgi:hypothetical protein